MNKLITFALSAMKTESPLMNIADRIAEKVTPGQAHAIGATSGVTGLALYAELAKHLTVLVGLAVAMVALAGGCFYATYWAIKAIREWQALRAGVSHRRKP